MAHANAVFSVSGPQTVDPDAGIGAVLPMQYRPFYDDVAIEALQGFEARVYEYLQ